jgi:hypothetical protein
MMKITRCVPEPVPRIRDGFSGHYWPALASRGFDARKREDSLLARPAGTTGGDLNPTCLLGVLGPLVSGGLIAGRRSRPYPQLLASHGASFSLGPGSVIGSLFRFRRTLSRLFKVKLAITVISLARVSRRSI